MLLGTDSYDSYGKLEAGMKMRSWFTGLISMYAAVAFATQAHAADRHEIDAKVTSTLSTFYEKVKGGDELVQKASGVLVFPEIVKGGFGVGGEFGEGALLIDGNTVDYYNIGSASIGFQIGIQVKSEVILFMEASALESFRQSRGWEAGVDGSVALVTLGVGGEIDTHTIQQPVIGFIFSNKGLMYNLTFEGSKITRIDK